MSVYSCLYCQYHCCDYRPGGGFFCAAIKNRKLPYVNPWKDNNELKGPAESYKAPSWCPLPNEEAKGEPNPFSNAIP